ncbi:MAG: bifunctional phosphopantothenoylcysteine decarboxylase/phosphopantothenate--cysteine ligase CoaBC [Thermoplasmata archaeon]|nr:bifunctional phosphopantothenoylcysteine decarboxylase/phosphopantothenate--cysteine ligase CoaBC [Thermoplasmata archaeon]
MHPINDIRGSTGSTLKGKRIVLCITGSIAAVETIKLARELARLGADVIPVMSRAATKIVHPDSVHFATGNIPILELDGALKHVELCGDSPSKADILLIAPATANTISKIACGIDDTPVTTMATCALGSKMPIIIVPAMHASMYRHMIVLENVEKLEKLGVVFAGPRIEEKKAKMAHQDEIIAKVCRATGPGDLKKIKVLVIAGSTREPIDDVRFISNVSSGRTGLMLALEAYRRGADVEIWAGAGLKVPDFMESRNFTSVGDLEKMAGKTKASIVLVPAAISDFIPEHEAGKMSSEKSRKIELKPAPKILGLLNMDGRILVGFKAETGITQKELEKRALERLKLHGLDMIVANLLEDVGPENTKAIIMSENNRSKRPSGLWMPIKFKGKKSELATIIFDKITGM